MEIEYAKLTKTPAFIFNHRNKESSINEFSEKLLEHYSVFHNKILESAKQNTSLYKERLSCLKNKKCLCGSDLVYISSFDFWGCKSYKDQTKKHITFSGKNPVIYPVTCSINAHWVSDIIKDCDLKGVVFAKEVYDLFINSGLDDLRIKYGYDTTEKSIMNYVKTKGRSVDQEHLAMSFLEDNFDKVLYQQCITYKIKDSKETFCIPDFICSNNEVVKVVDAKLSYAEDDKMDRYVQLIEFIMMQRKDKRKVSGAHVFYHNSEWEPKSRHEIITISSL